jgi:hypothetical protein
MFRRTPAENQAMSNALLHRLLRKPAAPTTLRMNVCPPDICPARETLWQSTLRWLVGNNVEVVPSLRTPLERARSEFVSAMNGLLDSGDDGDLLRRAQHARSLRELWHLRSELYTMIARRVSQAEADLRLARVNQYFPTRAQRTGNPATEAADVQ